MGFAIIDYDNWKVLKDAQAEILTVQGMLDLIEHHSHRRNYGSSLMSINKKAVKTAERCQRNWDYSIPIPDEDIKTLVEVATTMPTKQNRKFYDLIVSSNPEFNKICYTHAVDPNNSHFVNREIHRNTQANAPLIMIWRTTDQTEVEASDMFKDDYMKNYYTSVGVSSGATVLTANALGYRTGY